MDLGAAGLHEQPFRTHGRPLSTVSYASHQQALQALVETCNTPNGLSLLQGPALAGKSTLIRFFVDTLPEDCSVAVVDGKDLNTTALLEAALRQFGYVFEHSSPNELLGMMRVFALQQAASDEPPLLIIENTHALRPSALRALCELADLNIRGTSALKIVLVGDRPLKSIIEASDLRSLARRVKHDFHLHPLTNEEAMDYLYAKLRAAGSEVPESVFPVEVCTELWRASGGWPGILDRLALLSLAKAETLPVAVEKVERPVLPQGTWGDAEEAEFEQQSTAMQRHFKPLEFRHLEPNNFTDYNRKTLTYLLSYHIPFVNYLKSIEEERKTDATAILLPTSWRKPASPRAFFPV